MSIDQDALDILEILKIAAVPILKGAGIVGSDAVHAHAIGAARLHYERHEIRDFVERCDSWSRLHLYAIKILKCKHCGGSGKVAHDWMEENPPMIRCDECRGHGMAYSASVDECRKAERKIIRELGVPLLAR